MLRNQHVFFFFGHVLFCLVHQVSQDHPGAPLKNICAWHPWIVPFANGLSCVCLCVPGSNELHLDLTDERCTTELKFQHEVHLRKTRQLGETLFNEPKRLSDCCNESWRQTFLLPQPYLRVRAEHWVTDITGVTVGA